MTKIYLSYNNIVSPVGFSTLENVTAIEQGGTGIKKHYNELYPNGFYSSIIEEELLNTHFSKLEKNTQDYTRLEKMMLLSLSDVIRESGIKITPRTGLIISTTKGNIECLDKQSKFQAKRAYLTALGEVLQTYYGFENEPVIISNACVSGLLSVAVAKRLIQQGVYDDVLVVSGDSVTDFILSGFQSFQAISDEPCRPFSKNRKGITIGEAAASVLVTANKNFLSKDSVIILGDGSCNDANHISGPSRTGEGLYRSIQSAYEEARISSSEVDYISAHGTATLYNDEMESIAFDRCGLNTVPLNSLKGYYGHTLGASGLLETIIGMQSLYHNTLYPSMGYDELGVSKNINVISKIEAKKLSVFLKTASGFGGCNTAVLFEKVKI